MTSTQSERSTGWICPVCGCGNAPWKGTCDCVPAVTSGDTRGITRYSDDFGETWNEIVPPSKDDTSRVMMTLFGP